MQTSSFILDMSRLLFLNSAHAHTHKDTHTWAHMMIKRSEGLQGALGLGVRGESRL